MSFVTSLNQSAPFPSVPVDLGIDDEVWPFISALEFLDQGVQVFDLSATLLFANRASRQHDDAPPQELGSSIRQPLPCHNWGQAQWQQVFNDLEPSRPLCVGRRDGLGADLTLIRLRHPGGHQDRDVVMVGSHRAAVCSELAFDAWADGAGLTRAERRVVTLLADGEEPKVAAHILCITEHTVRTHIRRVLEKAGVRSIKALIRRLAMLPGIDALPGARPRHELTEFGALYRN